MDEVTDATVEVEESESATSNSSPTNPSVVTAAPVSAPTSSSLSSATGSALGSATNVGFGVHNGSLSEYFAPHQSFGFTDNSTQSNTNATSGPGTAMSSNDGPPSDTEVALNLLKKKGASESDVCQAIGMLSRHEDPRIEWAIDRLLGVKCLEKIDNEGRGDCLFAAFLDARNAAPSDGAQRHFQILTARLHSVEWASRTYETGDIPGIREAIEANVDAWFLDEEVDSETGEKKSKKKPANSELSDVEYYCSKLKVEGEKGGEVEILGLAHHFKTTIVIIDYASGQYTVISPGDKSSPMNQDRYELRDGFYPPENSTILAHVWNRQHYVAIREKDEVRPCSFLCALLLLLKSIAHLYFVLLPFLQSARRRFRSLPMLRLLSGSVPTMGRPTHSSLPKDPSVLPVPKAARALRPRLLLVALAALAARNSSTSLPL